jgi:uncharacterized protein YajQ (UPF0234 family)
MKSEFLAISFKKFKKKINIALFIWIAQDFIKFINIKNGIEKEKAKIISKLIKDSGIKVQSSIMDEKIRVTAKKIDDLQLVYQMLRTHKEVDIELQMENMKRD